jgi:hypothetical protein
MWPTGLTLGGTVPVFIVQPEDDSFRPGDLVELRAVFRFPGILDGRLDLPYQWQKQDEDTWRNLTNVTNTTLSIENAQAQHAGNYRLRATFHCQEFFSRVAEVTVAAPTRSVQAQTSGPTAN